MHNAKCIIVRVDEIVFSHFFCTEKPFTKNISITSFSQYTTICFVSFLYSVFNEHLWLVFCHFLCTESNQRNFIEEISFGGDDGIRTHDPLLAGQVLSQLSYTPIIGLCFSPFYFAKLFEFCLVGPSGLEPPTSCLSGTRSNLLSYEPMWLVCDSHT